MKADLKVKADLPAFALERFALERFGGSAVALAEAERSASTMDNPGRGRPCRSALQTGDESLVILWRIDVDECALIVDIDVHFLGCVRVNHGFGAL